MFNLLNQYDHSLMLWLNHDGGLWSDTFWYAVSYKFSWIPLYAAILAVMTNGLRTSASTAPARRPWLQRILPFVVLILVIVTADQLSSGLIKPWIQRLRPSHQPGIMELLHYVGDYRGGMYGFVSSHAANTAALALWVSLALRKRSVWVAMGTFYLINCYSRIYLGVHYPGDIICGTTVGIICALLGYRVCRHQLALLRHHAWAPYIAMTFWASAAVMAVIAVAYSV